MSTDSLIAECWNCGDEGPHLPMGIDDPDGDPLYECRNCGCEIEIKRGDV